MSYRVLPTFGALRPGRRDDSEAETAPRSGGRTEPQRRRRGRPALALIATALFLAIPGTVAHAAVISFDELSAPAPGGQGLTVNVQYADQGVSFNDLDAFSYAPEFAHSPTVGVEPCVAVEFCQVPARAQFTAAQDRVKVWVGYNAALPDPLPVKLTAFDGAGNQLGVADATLAASASPTPIQTPLEIDPPGEEIRRVEVSTESGYTAGLAIDDLEFSTVGPPPPCNASGVPSVNLVQPAAGLAVQNNQFLLRGSVNGNGAPITGATVVAQSGTTRTATAYPSLIDADGGQFGPVNFNGLLGPGANDVVVTATNCLGTGSSASRSVTLEEIDPGTEFRQLGMIEITQGIQEPNNSVPLVAATPSTGKRTFARVYLGLQGGEAAISSVSGRLTASRPDGSRPGGPIAVESLNPVTVEAAATAQSARSTLGKSLNFELPNEWLTAGQLHLQLDRLEVEGVQSTLPCRDCENPFPNGSPALKTFHTVPPLRIWLVRVPWSQTPGAATNVPTQFEIDMLASWLRRAYPTAEVRDTQMFLPAQDGPPGFVDDTDDGIDQSRDGFLCDDVNSELSEWVQSLQAQPASTRFYGVVSDAGGNFMRGCAQIGGRFGSGPSGPGTFGWDNDGTYGDWYGGHEIGHNFDRRHPGFCGETDDDDSFPMPDGLIGTFGRDFQGLDAGDANLGPPMQLYDWRDGWSDVMTYCSKQWISDYTYRGILGNLCNAEKASCPNRAELRRGRPGPAAGRDALAAGKAGRRLALSGTLDLSEGEVSLESLAVQRGLRLSTRPARSRYAVELIGRGGRGLGRYPFEPKTVSDLPAGIEQATIDEVVPFKPATRRIAIERGRKRVAAVRVSRHAPKVRITAPKRVTGPKNRVKVRWRGSDADGDRLHYTLLYSHRGRNFIPIASGLRKRSFRVDLRRLPGGPRARFRVVASDGVLTGTGGSRRLSVAAKAPRVSVSSPADQARFLEGESIQLVAAVDDLQDPQLPPERVSWRSDIAGPLGQGSAITTRLPPGSHEISLSATNGAGLTTTETLTLEIEPIPPTLDAVLLDP